MNLAYKTKAELTLEYLESLNRPLTDDESDQLRRSLHAVYCRNRRNSTIQQHRKEELALLREVERESCQLDPGRYER